MTNSEFSERNVMTGLLRGAVTFAAVFVGMIGLVVALMIAWAGAIIVLVSIGALVWSTISSLNDHSRLKWLNVFVKGFFALTFSIGLIAILVS